MVLDRAAGETGRCGGKNRLGGALGAVALALFEIGRDRQVGRRRHVAAMMDHRLEATAPSGSPRENAKPALVVASALKPKEASSFAVPMSQGLGMTKVESCKARKTLPLSTDAPLYACRVAREADLSRRPAPGKRMR